MKAALLRHKQGVDVGNHSPSLTEAIPQTETTGNWKISLSHQTGRYYRSELKKNARVCSYYQAEKERFPAVFTYDSGSTKFLILAIDAASFNQSSSILCSYLRQQQILDYYSGFPVIPNSPFVYQLCKRNETETVAFFANIFEDEMWDFDIELDRVYQEAETFGVEATLEGNRLHISSTVPAYGMFALKLK